MWFFHSGQEKIYTFTPATTGTYQIQVTAASSGFIYFYKAASGGCSATGWTCIDDINSAGNYGSLSLIGGTQYYFMLDAEATAASSQTFSVVCAGTVSDPCLNITSISAAGVNVTSTTNGSGAYLIPTSSCGSSLPGKKKFTPFTPLASGNYQIDLTAASGGSMHYFYKAASDGCSGTGWTCIGSASSPAVFGALSLTAGTQYYIMTDAVVTAAMSHTFNINFVPDPCTSITNISAAGVSVTSATRWCRAQPTNNFMRLCYSGDRKNLHVYSAYIRLLSN